ncbi:MAG: WD40 repeat domain-containing protein [Planctomycetota bacterium]|nr:WD40 repeat domain-containing protein [Planctomycetota bacterium]
MVARGSRQGLSVWELSTGSHRTIGADLPLGSTFAVAADGRTLAASDSKSILHLWALPEGKELARWEAGTSVGTAIAFHPDGTLLVTCGGGRMSDVRFWDLAAIRSELEEIGLDW